MIDTNKYIANTFLIPRGHAFVSAAPRHEPAGAQQTPHAVQLQLSSFVWEMAERWKTRLGRNSWFGRARELSPWLHTS